MLSEHWDMGGTHLMGSAHFFADYFGGMFLNPLPDVFPSK